MEIVKLVVMVVNHDGLSLDGIISTIQKPSRFTMNSATVMDAEVREIGEWSDDNPLNFMGQDKEAFTKLFSPEE